ncbi:periplasmic binding protein [Pseudoflavonifractor capillosus ATCC 29799]|uniref:Periplasmic binding protein n=1 Tax=Pseudoflavonifractor capillosus ATCC 29799 TaxID=411467 RepID=A6NSV4_9FIRM|nr:ABC transporter substrate-binding protein [Pseudoflavonifractor capillosus]EDN00931.1 periplasmic binding protein [Pseudoflavonifractor capillosus ATCC 29799]
MKRIFSILMAAMMLLSGCAGTANESEPSQEPWNSETAEALEQTPEGRTVVDHDGIEVDLPEQIDRIAVGNIGPMASVLTLFLGSGESIVGMSPMSMSAAENGILGELFPELLDADTSFLQGSNINVEKLLTLEPDLVLIQSGQSEVRTQLENAGLTVVAFGVGTFKYDIINTYEAWIDLLSQIFPANDKMEEVTAYSKEVLELVQSRVSDIPEAERKRALFLFQYDETQMIASGRNFFGQYWCESAGAVNVAQDIEAGQATITMEQVYEWQPDVIFITNFTNTKPADLYANAVGSDDWSLVKAVQEQQVYKMPLGSFRTYSVSADMPVTLLWVAKTIYPDLFSDIDTDAEVKDFYQRIYGVTLTDEQVAAMYDPQGDVAYGM